MVSFLFWNINKRPIQGIISNLVVRHQVDILMLAECEIPVAVMLQTLNEQADYHYVPEIGCEKIKIYARYERGFIQPVFETKRTTVRHLALPGMTDIFVAVSHLPSKLYQNESSQAIECIELAREIRRIEDEAGHSRTVLVGDLNMNPFEDGVVGAAGLHAVMSQRIARRGARTVQGRDYRFFYNPMWSLMGDESMGPTGSYFHSSSEHRAYFWHMFDQVLVRPALLDMFDFKSLSIVEADGSQSLLNEDDTPNADVASDHLPLHFRLNL